jgi:hypothetical protein
MDTGGQVNHHVYPLKNALRVVPGRLIVQFDPLDSIRLCAAGRRALPRIAYGPPHEESRILKETAER